MTKMFAHSVYTTGLLALGSVVAKALLDTREDVSVARELLSQAVHWQDVSLQDTDAVLRIQHSTRALAMLDAARIVASDRDLERCSGIQVSRMAKELERTLGELRHQIGVPRGPLIDQIGWHPFSVGWMPSTVWVRRSHPNRH